MWLHSPWLGKFRYFNFSLKFQAPKICICCQMRCPLSMPAFVSSFKYSVLDVPFKYQAYWLSPETNNLSCILCAPVWCQSWQLGPQSSPGDYSCWTTFSFLCPCMFLVIKDQEDSSPSSLCVVPWHSQWNAGWKITFYSGS